MVPVSSSRTVTAQRRGTEAMISEIHRQSSVGMPTTARATMPLLRVRGVCSRRSVRSRQGYKARSQLPAPIRTPLTADVARLECLAVLAWGTLSCLSDRHLRHLVRYDQISLGCLPDGCDGD